MKVQVTARHTDVSDSMREYAEKKVMGLLRYLDRIHRTEITWDGGEGELFRMQLSIAAVKGQVFIVDVEADSLRGTVDLAVEKMERQLKKYNEKLKSKNRKQSGRLKTVHLDNVPPLMDQEEAAEPTYEEILENPDEA